MKEVIISDAKLRQAAESGPDAFLSTVIEATLEAIGGELNADNMNELSADQVTLLAYHMLHEEVMDGGFVQLIHNGWGPFIFDNPFAKAMRLFGAHDFSKLVYKGKKLYDEHKDELTKECSDDEFMALFEKFEEFDDLDDKFIEMEEEVTATIAYYVDEHMDDFITIEK
jgi:hypothetical protein